MMPPFAAAAANHLWQSTLVAALAFLLTIPLRRNYASVRHGIWLAASIKFLVPFSLLVSAGSHFAWRNTVPVATARFSMVVEEVGHPFVPSRPALPAPPATAALDFGAILAGLWLCGSLALIVNWTIQCRRVGRLARLAPPDALAGIREIVDRLCGRLGIAQPIHLVSAEDTLEPGVVGILRPVLWLPSGIVNRLEPAQLEAILAHELCHIRGRDNLAAAIHMVVEALFWFHPLVWWMGAHLVQEREQACDEAVIGLLGSAETYAEGILRVCRFSMETPVACISGVSGGDLKHRIVRIMDNRPVTRLDPARRLLVTVAGIATIACPLAFGILNATPMMALQTSTPTLGFEVASVKPSAPNLRGYSIQETPGGRVVIRNATLMTVLATAYGVEYQPFRISGAPGWVNSTRYDMEAKSPDPKANHSQIRDMLQGLLKDRFQLAVHTETRELPIYSLVVTKGGPKLNPPKDPAGPHGINFRNGGLQIQGVNATMAELAEALGFRVEHTVIDHTGIQAGFDFQLEFVPDTMVARFGEEHPIAADTEGISLFTALQEQLGLKLDATKGPVDLIVVDRISKPSEN